MTDDTPCLRYFHMGQWPCYVGFTTSEEEFNAEMKRLKIGNAPECFIGNSSAVTHCFDPNADNMLMVIVCIKRTRRKVEQVAALLAHESTHVMQYMQDEFFQGQQFDRENQAYIVQYLTQNFLYEYRNPGKGMSRAVEPNAPDT
jgi:hypothetical protein